MKKFSKRILSYNKYVLFAFLIFQMNCSLAEKISQPNAQTSAINQYQGKNWTLTSISGESVTLSQYQGQPVILVFWAT
jgi:cytochrome oxidase Cu insertion factor (SCO1/SenC/PrrC family)